jgi:hypothetical protein
MPWTYKGRVVLAAQRPLTIKANLKVYPGGVKSQVHLNSLWNHAVKAGGVLNPYGRNGNTHYGRRRVWWKDPSKAFKELGLKRKRVKLEAKKAHILEAHELQRMARENATLAMETLIEISKDKAAPQATRIAASSVILDRAYGKSSQTSITAKITDEKATNIDSTELDTRISRALKRVEDLTNRTPKAGKSPKRPTNLREYN